MNVFLRRLAGYSSLADLICMPLFVPLTCLLNHAEDRLWCLVQRMRCRNLPGVAAPTLSPAIIGNGWSAGPDGAGPWRYMVSFQITAAELREGRVVASYVAPGVRLFDTEELNVIWAELVDELGPSPYRLGLEILAIDACPLPTHPTWAR